VNTNGTIDETFGIGGKITTDFGFQKDDMAYAVARLNDGKIIAVGYASSAKPTTNDIALARYNTELNVGIKEPLVNNGLAIFPNPATSNITVVTSKQAISQNSKVAIYNTQGQLLTMQHI
jgi:nicotinic acid phosphoribosyltransferase